MGTAVLPLWETCPRARDIVAQGTQRGAHTRATSEAAREGRGGRGERAAVSSPGQWLEAGAQGGDGCPSGRVFRETQRSPEHRCPLGGAAARAEARLPQDIRHRRCGPRPLLSRFRSLAGQAAQGEGGDR